MTEAECLAEITRVAGQGRAATAAETQWLLACLERPVKRVQRTAAEALADLEAAGVAVRAALEARLAAAMFAHRWGAAYALARLGEPPASVLPILVEAMGSDDGDLRWAAARIAVEQVRTPELTRCLLDAAAEPRAELRKMALYCLRDLGVRTPECDARCRAALADDAIGVRLAGLSALARLGVDRAATARAVLPLLGDPEPGVRRAAAATLGRVGVASPEVVVALERAAGASDEFLARAARQALASLRRPTDG
jgi:HEAT repeat protein